MLTFTDEVLRNKLKETTPVSTEHFAFLPFDNLEKSVLDDVEFFKHSPYVLDVPITGYIYDVHDGSIKKVES